MTTEITSPIPGFKVALLGQVGGGKTHAIRSLIDAGLEVFAIFTEDSRGPLNDIPSDKLHWAYIPPAEVDWDTMFDSMKKINTLSYESLTGLKDVDKRKYDQMMRVVETCKNFVDERTGQAYGDITNWGTNRVLYLDSLSGLNKMAMDLVVGSKPVKAMSDWQVAMDNLDRLITRFCMGLHCHFVMTGHVEREADEITGGVKLMISTLGKKLPAQMGRFFDELIYTQYAGPGENDFYWSTSEPNFALKNRYLPKKSKLPASFGPLVSAWKAKGGIITPTVK